MADPQEMARFFADAAHAVEQYNVLSRESFDLFQIGEFKDVLLVGENRLEAGWAWMRDYCLAHKEDFLKHVETERPKLRKRSR